jgi:hypothetical protein
MTESKWRNRLAKWLATNWRVLLYTPALAAAGAFAAWASFTSLATLGVYVGFGSGRPWLLPAILDVAAYATTVAYMLRPNLARALVSGGFLTITALGNAQAHYFNPASQDLVAPLPYAIGWGVAPPLIWFAVAHFTAFEMHPDAFAHFWPRRAHQAPVPIKTEITSPKRQPKPPPTNSVTRSNSAGVSPESVAAWLNDQGYPPGSIGRSKLVEMRRTAGEPITTHQAKRALQVWNSNGHEPAMADQ